jgi:hypothetical protein
MIDRPLTPVSLNERGRRGNMANAGVAPRNTMDASESLETDQAMANPARPAGKDRQMRKSSSASPLAFPQVTRKKERYVILDLSILVPSNPSGCSSGLIVRGRHRTRRPRARPTRPHGIDRPIRCPSAPKPCLNDL